MTNTNNKPTRICKKYLGIKLFKQYARPLIKAGKTEKEIRDGFTLDLLNKLTSDFCKKYNIETY